MNPPELTRLARELELEDDNRFLLRLTFGISCVERVRGLLTEQSVVDCFHLGKQFLEGKTSKHGLAEVAQRAADIATKHPGSGSLDGSGNAAVSASHGVAAALAGRALEAAEYAAYAKVYSYASYAVTDISNYADEHTCQVNKLRALAQFMRK
jgi:hypothetical protein